MVTLNAVGAGLLFIGGHLLGTGFPVAGICVAIVGLILAGWTFCQAYCKSDYFRD